MKNGLVEYSLFVTSVAKGSNISYLSNFNKNMVVRRVIDTEVGKIQKLLRPIYFTFTMSTLSQNFRDKDM